MIKDVMSTSVVTVSPGTPIKEIAATLVAKKISAVPVVDEEGFLVGIVSESDLIALQTTPDPRSHLLQEGAPPTSAHVAADVMTAHPVTLPAAADVAVAARLMLQKGIKRIPIVASGHVIGIIARRDLIGVLARSDEEIRRDLDETLAREATLLGALQTEVADGVVAVTGATEERTRRLAEILARRIPGVVGVRFVDD
ncbi:MAG: CBS domain-containing protein [Actinomycetota bacterium]